MKLKKVLSLVLCFAIISSTFIISAFGATSQHTESISYLFYTDQKYWEGTSMLSLFPDTSSYPKLTKCKSTVQVQANNYPNGDCPVGHMGGKPELYNDNGSLIFSAVWTYNTVPGKFYLASYATEMVEGEGISVYAKGYASAWSGTNYYSVSLNRTPSLTITYLNRSSNALSKANLLPNIESGINNNNQSYGSAMLANTIAAAPDLIAAVGIGGIEGYVYRDELYSIGRIDSPDDIGSISITPTYISLYAVDGITVIGRFLVDTPDVVVS